MRTPGRFSSKLLLSAAFCAFVLLAPTIGFAACVNDPDTAQKAAAFTTNPSSLLEGPNGPRSPDDVAADVQTFVASYPQALPAVLNILKDLSSKGPSTSALQKAIGTGLGKAANVCKTTDLTFSLEIQGDLGAIGSPDANAQYAALTGNDPTRSVALSGAATGSSGGVGGQTTPTGNTFSGASVQTFVANSVSNNPTNYFSSSVGSAGSAGGTTTTTTIICTVSGSC
ncbi:hypothetical protein I3J27_07730 [Bradyrhizobium xenonodulans]|uniref:Lipoprotein n=1 Tax=Bradyrhizobium xenonodulans TaxID=2736875 RepID=A0ABY7MPG4_9BRAD|nr:hypothetical protein [Bradyrhizobium xenonodulans]WBL80301.1 hypothetical protein I3J27_07730 [Bradyrhizobium xenonodulans]